MVGIQVRVHAIDRFRERVAELEPAEVEMMLWEMGTAMLPLLGGATCGRVTVVWQGRPVTLAIEHGSVVSCWAEPSDEAMMDGGRGACGGAGESAPARQA